MDIKDFPFPSGAKGSGSPECNKLGACTFHRTLRGFNRPGTILTLVLGRLLLRGPFPNATGDPRAAAAAEPAGGERTSARLVVDELQAGGAVALEADHHVLTHVGTAAVVQQTLVHTWGEDGSVSQSVQIQWTHWSTDTRVTPEQLLVQS